MWRRKGFRVQRNQWWMAFLCVCAANTQQAGEKRITKQTIWGRLGKFGKSTP
ncbi:hypothetical protein [Sellimonas intestinalis]|uniref:hypothetical protein n=1 Tax=Sellimonas intestinalis TaxID=1653434 RepID=UPI003AB23BC9